MRKASNTLKRIVALVAAFAMALALVPTAALADATTQHTITINEPTGNVDTHSYEAYQVFAGTYNSTTKQLEGITWGAGVNGDALLTALKADATIGSKFASATDAPTAAAAMSGLKATETEALAKVIAANLSSTKAATGKSPLTVTGDGYYFVKDVSEKLTSDTYSKYILQVCDDVEITAKDTTTTSQKKVKDTNDSATENATSGWQDSADYDIGDMVPFQLTGTVASDYADYASPYYFAFHDTHNKTQLSDPTSVTVKIDGTEVTTGYELKTTDAGFDVVFADLKQTAAHAGSVITVEYESQLLSGAQIGAKGNINGSNIEFSNDSNNEQHHGTTPEDTVIVFTYTVNVNKYAEKVADGNKLAGAGFTLYKKYADTTKVPAGKTADSDGWVAVQEIAAGENTTFEFKGIDDGEYKLVETTTPTGYNTIDPIVFTVTGTHTVNFESGQVNENGKVGDAYVLTDLTATSDQASFSANKTDGALDGTLTTDVVNKSGSTLPSTGGMGVLPFVLVGCGIAVAAGIGLHVARSRREDA